MSYTSEDYRRAIAETASTGTGAPVYDAIAIAALRIAVNVAKPGVIEEAVNVWQYDTPLEGIELLASTIRAVLQKETSHAV